jgi:hypothetical protein
MRAPTLTALAVMAFFVSLSAWQALHNNGVIDLRPWFSCLSALILTALWEQIVLTPPHRPVG